MSEAQIPVRTRKLLTDRLQALDAKKYAKLIPAVIKQFDSPSIGKHIDQSRQYGQENETLLPKHSNVKPLSRFSHKTAQSLFSSIGFETTLKAVPDGSIKTDDTSVFSGEEWTTPIVKTPAQIQELQKHGQILADMGSIKNASCGDHVHIGITQFTAQKTNITTKDDEQTQLKITQQLIINFIAAFDDVNDLCFGNDYNTRNWGEDTQSNRADFISKLSYAENMRDLIKTVSPDREVFFNLQSIDKHGTLEIRGLTYKGHQHHAVEANLQALQIEYCDKMVQLTLAQLQKNPVVNTDTNVPAAQKITREFRSAAAREMLIMGLTQYREVAGRQTLEETIQNHFEVLSDDDFVQVLPHFTLTNILSRVHQLPPYRMQQLADRMTSLIDESLATMNLADLHKMDQLIALRDMISIGYTKMPADKRRSIMMNFQKATVRVNASVHITL